jgi:hypothetical protein
MISPYRRLEFFTSVIQILDGYVGMREAYLGDDYNQVTEGKYNIKIVCYICFTKQEKESLTDRQTLSSRIPPAGG